MFLDSVGKDGRWGIMSCLSLSHKSVTGNKKYLDSKQYYSINSLD